MVVAVLLNNLTEGLMRPTHNLFIAVFVAIATLSGCTQPSMFAVKCANCREVLGYDAAATFTDPGGQGGATLTQTEFKHPETGEVIPHMTAKAQGVNTEQVVWGNAVPAVITGGFGYAGQVGAAGRIAGGLARQGEALGAAQVEATRVKAAADVQRATIGAGATRDAATTSAGARVQSAQVRAGAQVQSAQIGAGATRDAAGTTAAAMRYQGDQGLAGQQARAAATDRATAAGQAQFAETRGAQVAAQQAEAAANNPINAGNPMSNLNPINVLRNAFRF